MSNSEVRPYTSGVGHASHKVLPEFYYTSKTHSVMSTTGGETTAAAAAATSSTGANSYSLTIPSKSKKFDKHSNHVLTVVSYPDKKYTADEDGGEDGGEGEEAMINGGNTNRVCKMNTQEAFQILTAPIGYDLPTYLQSRENEMYAPHRPSTSYSTQISRRGKLPSLSELQKGNAFRYNTHSKMSSTLPLSRDYNNNKFDEAATLQLVNALCPPLDRSVDEALNEAKLEDPFKHHTNDYHNSQQAALNAEMRGKVEKLTNEWNKSMQQLYKIVSSYPTENSSVNYAATNGLIDYCKCYKCTANDELHVEPQELIDTLKLKLRLHEINEVKQIQGLSLDTLRRALDSLLNSPYALVNLEEYLENLRVYDAIVLQHLNANVSAELSDGNSVRCITNGITNEESHHSTNEDKNEDEKEEKVKEEAVVVVGNEVMIANETDNANSALIQNVSSSEVNNEGVALPSEAAVMLHSKFHYNPTEYADEELHKTLALLLAMEQRMQNAKSAKEVAVDRASPAEALRQLHAEIDFGNDLLLLNKARMLLVSMHNDDVMELREVTLRCINAAQYASGHLQQRLAQLLPRLNEDKSTVLESKIALEEEVKVLEKKEQDAQDELKAQMEQIENEEKEMWQEVLNSLIKINESANRKVKLVQQRMSLKEQRAREMSAIIEQMKAHDIHNNDLTECECTLMKWQQASEMYGKYVEAYIPKLLKHLNQIEDEDEELRLKESQNYVRRFESFTYAVEEARAKREVQVDRMRLLQRSCVRNEEWADATLDPLKEQYSQRFVEANREIDEVNSYLEYLHNIESDRKDEVEPILHQVIAYNTAMQGTLEANKEYISGNNDAKDDNHKITGDKEEEDQKVVSQLIDRAQNAHSAAGMTKAPLPSNDGKFVVPSSSTTTTMMSIKQEGKQEKQELGIEAKVPLMATMDHPIISARLIGIAHEEQYLQKHRALNEQELSAAEDKRTSVRKSKAELDMMASRYNNVEAIKHLLMKDLKLQRKRSADYVSGTAAKETKSKPKKEKTSKIETFITKKYNLQIDHENEEIESIIRLSNFRNK